MIQFTTFGLVFVVGASVSVGFFFGILFSVWLERFEAEKREDEQL